MADNDRGGDKTERPSAQKLRKARREGQAARSRDLATAVGILVGLKVFVLMLPACLDDMRRLFRLVFAPLGGPGALDDALSVVSGAALALLVKMVLPLLAVPLAIVAAGMVPGGLAASAANLRPKFGRFNPVANLGNLFTRKHWTAFLASAAKAAMLGLVLWMAARAGIKACLELQRMALPDALVAGSGLVLDGLMAMVAVFVVFALVDVPVQHYLFMRNQRMSKEEVKEEHKRSEGRPEVRQRIRQLRQQLARRGVRATVPGADVVIVNPAHYAVALRYDTARADAPYVVAKGVDEMALYIREVAREHGVETLALPPLARAIYHTSQVQQQIPAQLYQAVSQVLHYVLQLDAFRTGKRQAPPRFPTEMDVPSHLSEARP